MALPDLVSAAELAADLAPLGLTAAESALLPAVAAAASANVRAFCRRDFSLLTYDELYGVDRAARSVVLRQFPVASVSRVAAGETAVAEITNESTATNYRATVALAASETDTGLAPSGLLLTRHSAGVAYSETVAFGAGPPTVRSVDQLVAEVNGLGDGWRAEAVDGLGGWGVSDLRPLQGAMPALFPRAARLTVHAEDLDFGLDERTGVLNLGRVGGASASGRWGPGWPDGGGDDAGPYGGALGLRVVYSAGYAAVPGDVRQAVVETAKAAFDRARTDGALKSESDGTLSWTARDLSELTALPASVRTALAPRVNHRA